MNTGATSTNQGRRFQLEAKLGAGAFGEVLLAEMEGGGGFRRKVALKLLHPDMARHRDVARRMRDEAGSSAASSTDTSWRCSIWSGSTIAGRS